METKEYLKQEHVAALLQLIGTEPRTLTQLAKQYTKSVTTAHTILQRLVREGVIKRIISKSHHPTYILTEATTSYLGNNTTAVYRSPQDIEEFVKEPDILSIIKSVMDEPKQLFQIEKHSTRSHSNVFETLHKLVDYGYIRKLKNGHKKEYIATDKSVLLVKNLAEAVDPVYKEVVETEYIEDIKTEEYKQADEERDIENTIRKILLTQELLDEVREAIEKRKPIDVQSYYNVIKHQIAELVHE